MITVILLFIAVICWLLAAFSVPAPRSINWLALGMFFWGVVMLYGKTGK